MEHRSNTPGNDDPGLQPTTSKELLQQQSIVALKQTIFEAIIAGRKNGETTSVLNGESRAFERLDDGAEVLISRYGANGSRHYTDELSEKHGFDAGTSTVESYVGIEAEFEGPALEYNIYLLSDGRAIGFTRLFARPIGSLNGPIGAEARRLAGRVGLEEQWMKFEQHAQYANIKEPTTAKSEGYTYQPSFIMTLEQIEAIQDYVAEHQALET